jgi:hypothetical protein
MFLDTTLGINLVLLFQVISDPRSAIDNKQFLLVLSNRALVTVIHLFLIATSNVLEAILPDV